MSAASDSYNPVVPPAYIGVSFLLSWVYLLFYARSAGIEAAAPISLMSFGYTLSAVLMVLTLLVVAFFVKKRVRFLTSVSVKAFAGVVLPAGTVVLVAGGYLQLPALLFLGGVLTGVASGDPVVAMDCRVQTRGAECRNLELPAASGGERGNLHDAYVPARHRAGICDDCAARRL